MIKRLVRGDCLNVLKKLQPCSIHALVTDPPAGISFMGKEWDDDRGGRDEWIKWLAQAMRECYRVMRPGAFGLVWALPRTSHWTATACENAGFEIRDVVIHLFGSGFPKSHNVSLAIDKRFGAKNKRQAGAKNPSCRKAQVGPNGWENAERPEFKTKAATKSAKKWDGFGTALKPASEHWILIQKPIVEETIAANVLKWGTGVLNIDAGRIGTDTIQSNAYRSKGREGCLSLPGEASQSGNTYDSKTHQGRFPANLILDEDSAKLLDAQSGVSKSEGGSRGAGGKNGKYSAIGAQKIKPGFGDVGGASRFFYCAKSSQSERNAGLEGMPLCRSSKLGGGIKSNVGNGEPGESSSEDRLAQNHHPTVKPIALMQYLIGLITPPEGVVLDPFMGSGTTGVAAVKSKLGFIGIEREIDFFAIAEKRIEKC